MICSKGFISSCVFHSNKNPKQLENVMNNVLDNIGNWLKANKLIFNVKKSHLILFNIKKNSKSINYQNIRIYVCNDELQHKETAKYLGVHFDKRFSWDEHIQYTNSKISRRLGILKKIRNYIQAKTLKNIFDSFIKFYVDYGTLI